MGTLLNRRRYMGGGVAPLPYDAEVEYLQSSGNQWLEIESVKYNASNSYRIECGVMNLSTAATYKGTITLSHTNSITAGTAKGDDSKTLTFGGTFKIPSITYDANGHITTWTTTTMTMPSNPNSDTKVNVTLATTSKAYLLGTTTTPTSTAQGVTSVADTGVYLTTTAGELCAKKFMVPITGSSSGYWGYDKGSRKFPLICDNGTNLWIGSEATVASTHHKGETYISTGWEGTLPTSEGTLYGNKTIYISIPYYSVPSGGTTGTWGGNNYAVYHTGYAPESYLTWGDKDFTGSNGVIDTCLNDALAAMLVILLHKNVQCFVHRSEDGVMLVILALLVWVPMLPNT